LASGEAEHSTRKCAEDIGGLSVSLPQNQAGDVLTCARSVIVPTRLAIYRSGQMLVSLGISIHWRPINRTSFSPRASKKNRGFSCALTVASRRSVALNENVLRLEDTGREGARAYPMGLCGEKKRLTRVLGDFACATVLIARSTCS
jgi:hypothetical protein